jgi:hypothetical protein
MSGVLTYQAVKAASSSPELEVSAISYSAPLWFARSKRVGWMFLSAAFRTTAMH